MSDETKCNIDRKLLVIELLKNTSCSDNFIIIPYSPNSHPTSKAHIVVPHPVSDDGSPIPEPRKEGFGKGVLQNVRRFRLCLSECEMYSPREYGWDPPSPTIQVI